jgi:hypothetical protein
MRTTPPNGHIPKPAYRRRPTLEYAPGLIVREGGAQARFRGWNEGQLRALENDFLAVTQRFAAIFNHTRQNPLQLRLSPEFQTGKQLVATSTETTPQGKKSHVISVYLCGRPEEKPEQLVFRVAQSLAQLINPGRIHDLVIFPARYEFESKVRDKLHNVIGGLPRYMNHRDAETLLGHKIGKNRDEVDLYKLLGVLVPSPGMFASAVSQIATGIIDTIETNVTTETLNISQNPWRYLRLMGLFSAVCAKLGNSGPRARSIALVRSAEFAHNMLHLEMQNPPVSYIKRSSIDPDEEAAKARFASIYALFYLAATEYYKYTSMPVLRVE